MVAPPTPSPQPFLPTLSVATTIITGYKYIVIDLAASVAIFDACANGRVSMSIYEMEGLGMPRSTRGLDLVEIKS